MENILASVRFKPTRVGGRDRSTKYQSKQQSQDCWRIYDSGNTVENLKTKQRMQFDYVFGEDSTNMEIFQLLVLPYLESAMLGVNFTVFAYGQTSSGKTHTIHGDSDSPGLIPQTLEFLFSSIASDSRKFTFKISYLEVYNEQVNDLLDTSKKNLEIRETTDKKIYIESLTEHGVENVKQAYELLSLGESSRKFAETNMNAHSSRSHTVFRITVEAVQDLFTQTSQINLVDLAGSEGVSKSGTEDMRLREGSNINRSLLYLSSVIEKLSASKGMKSYINFRDSKMTRLLQPALTGKSRTAIICTVNLDPAHYCESYNTLLFGTRAKKIKNDIVINEIIANESQLQSLEENNKKLLKRRAEDEYQIANLKEKVENAVLEKQRLEEVLKNMSEDYDKILKSLKISGEENLQMKYWISNLQNENRKYQEAAMEIENNNRGLKVELNLVSESFETQKKMLEETQKSKSRLEEEKCYFENEAEMTKKAMIELSEGDNRSKGLIFNLESDLEAKNKQCISMKESYEKLLFELENKNNLIRKNELDLENAAKIIEEQARKNFALQQNLEQEMQHAKGVLENKDREIEKSALKIKQTQAIAIESIEKKTKEIEDYTIKVQLLDQELKQSCNEIQNKNSLIMQMKEQINAMQTDLINSQSAYMDLQKHLNDKNCEIEHITKSNFIYIEEVKKLESIIGEKYSEAKEKDSHLENALKDVEGKCQTIQNLIEENYQKNNEIIKLKEELNNLNCHLNGLNQEYNIVQISVEDMKERLEKMNCLINVKENETLIKDQEISQKYYLIQEKDMEINQKNHLIQEKDKEISQKDYFIQEKDTEIHKLVEEMHSQSIEIKEMNGNIQKLKFEIASLDSMIENQHKEKHQYLAELDMKIEEFKEKETEICNQEIELKELSLKLNASEQSYINKCNELEDFMLSSNGEITTYKQELQNTYFEIDKLKHTIDQNVAKIIGYEEIYTKQIEQLNIYELQQRDLEDLVIEKEKKIECFQIEIANFHENYNTKSCEIAKAEEVCKSLLEKLKSKETTISKLETENEDMKKWELETIRLQEELKEKEDLIEKIQKDFNDIINQCTNKEKTLNLVSNDLSTQGQRVLDLELILNNQFQRTNSLEHDLDSVNSTCENLKRKNKELILELTSLNTIISEQKDHLKTIKEKDDKNSELLEQIKFLKTEVDKYRKFERQCEALKSDLDIQKAEYQLKESKIGKLRFKLREIKRKDSITLSNNESDSKRISDLTEAVSIFEAQLFDANSGFTKAVAECERLTFALNKSKLDNVNIAEMLKNAEEKCRMLERQIMHKRNASVLIDDLMLKEVTESERYSLMLSLKNDTEELKILKEDYEVETKKNQELTKEILELKKLCEELEEENIEKEWKIKQFVNEIEKKNKDVECLMSERETLFFSSGSSAKKIRMSLSRYDDALKELKENQVILEDDEGERNASQ